MCANFIFQHIFNLDLVKIRTTSAYVCCFVFRPHCHPLLVMVTTWSFLNSSCDYLAHIARSATKSRHIGHLLWSKILLGGCCRTCNQCKHICKKCAPKTAEKNMNSQPSHDGLWLKFASTRISSPWYPSKLGISCLACVYHHYAPWKKTRRKQQLLVWVAWLLLGHPGNCHGWCRKILEHNILAKFGRCTWTSK